MLMDKVSQDSSNNPEFYPVFPVYLARAYKDVVYEVGGKLEEKQNGHRCVGLGEMTLDNRELRPDQGLVVYIKASGIYSK